MFYPQRWRPAAFYTQLMAIITQGALKKLRDKMFDHMQDLPIRYFDTHSHGDIMSYYTNDIDTLRQMISQSLPQLLISGGDGADRLLHHGVLQPCWLTLVVVAGVVLHDACSSARSAAARPGISSASRSPWAGLRASSRR